MRLILVSLFALLNLTILAQDKIYLIDNSMVQGKIIDDSDRKITVLSSDLSQKTVYRKDIVLIIYADGNSVVVNPPKREKEKELIDLPEWSIGTIITQPIYGVAGISLEHKMGKRFTMEVNQCFDFGNRYGFESNTSLLHNFYFGKGKIQLLNSIGFNVNYQENPIHYFLDDGLLTEAYFAPYPHEYRSNFDAGLTLGSGIYFDCTKHLSINAQLFFMISHSNYYNQTYWNIEMDRFNSGINITYKF